MNKLIIPLLSFVSYFSYASNAAVDSKYSAESQTQRRLELMKEKSKIWGILRIQRYDGVEAPDYNYVANIHEFDGQTHSVLFRQKVYYSKAFNTHTYYDELEKPRRIIRSPISDAVDYRMMRILKKIFPHVDKLTQFEGTYVITELRESPKFYEQLPGVTHIDNSVIEYQKIDDKEAQEQFPLFYENNKKGRR